MSLINLIYCIQALIQKKYEVFRQEFPDLKAEVQSTLNEIAECCTILEPVTVSPPESSKPVETDLETLVFGDDDEYEEYGDSSLRRQLHEEISEEVAIHEKPVCIDISL